MNGRVPRTVWLFLAVTTAVRMYWAAHAPLANDEAYYWDWSRLLQLSYLDHPPAVAWLGAAAQKLFGPASGLSARGLIPFLHLGAVALLLKCAALLRGSALSRRQVWTVVLLCELVPAFSLEGVVLLPDSVLLPALALSLYSLLRAALATVGTSWRWAPLAGLAFGLAGLSKYHAAPIAAGMGLGLLCYGWRIGRLGEYLAFLTVTALLALLATLPVWVWNAEHDWASFRFQGAHGFSGLAWDPLAAGRFYIGQLLLLTPLVVVGGLHVMARQRRIDLALIVVAAAAPLLLLLELLAFGKQLLPHWLAPAFWLLVPLLALQPWRVKAVRANFICAGLITGTLPWLLALAPVRERLLASFEGKPGPLSELTLWQPLALALVEDPRIAPLLAKSTAARAANCQDEITLASLRWYWSAQLAYNLPTKPQVLSLDQNHRSYYHYRDHWPNFAGCPVLVIADSRHLDRGQLSKILSTWQEWSVVVPSHKDTEVLVLWGRFRERAELEPVAAAMHGFGGEHPAAY